MNKKDLMLTPEDYEALGLTQEQIDLFEDANAIVESLDLLPDDPAVMMNALDKLPNDYAAALRALDEMSQTNPEMFTKLMTMVSLANDVQGRPQLEVDPLLDKEALRVVSTMPNWKPGKQRGQAVRVKYTVPISFKLQ